LKDESAQAWTLNSLATCYQLSGQYRRALPLIEMSNKLREKAGDRMNLAMGLVILAVVAQIPIGKLDAAETNLRRSIEICREIMDEFFESDSHLELGRLLMYRGKFEESENEFIIALELFSKLNIVLYQGGVWLYRSFCALLMSSAEEALEHARKARELFDARYEMGIIRAESLLGAAHLMNGNLPEAEEHLNEALIRNRKINLVGIEPDILLELAKLRFKQNRKPEALKFAQEALQIADRCEYRLRQADIHNFLSEFYLDAGDLAKAREHGDSAKERAACGYVPALEKAEKLLKEIDLKVRSDR
jgi:tetratricopeptide (TPR) repeat protein